MDSTHPSPSGTHFLKLPAEVRLQIYTLLVLPRDSDDKTPTRSADYHDYDKRQNDTGLRLSTKSAPPTLSIRSIDPLLYQALASKGSVQHVRSTYSIRCDRFRARTLNTTYHCATSPRIGDSLGIMRANRQIHDEASELLYGACVFDFDTHVEAIVPFLADLTPFARSCVKALRIVKRALAYEKEFDRCEWVNAMRHLSCAAFGVGLRSLSLGVVAGRPGENGWDGLPTYTAADFRVLKDSEEMEWLRELLAIRGLQALDVGAIVEHCPAPTNSRALAAYISFSASIETGLIAFLREQMVQA